MSKVKGAKSLEGIPWDEMLYYDETSPSGLRHKNNKIRPNNLSIARFAGDIAGSKATNSNYWVYSSSSYGTFQCHRIVWYLVHGYDVPDDKLIDHIDGDRTNNNVNNLRLISEADNNRNAKLYKNNTSGVVGVYFDSKNNKGFRREYWKASWQEIDGSQRTKAFSIDKLGYDEARQLAIEYREQQIKRLNEEGANYSERHGT